jgi:hypothetical protein
MSVGKPNVWAVASVWLSVLPNVFILRPLKMRRGDDIHSPMNWMPADVSFAVIAKRRVP